MTLREFLNALRLYWKTFAAVAAAVLAAGVAWLILTPPQYVSHAQLLVAVQGNSTANAYQNDDVIIGRVHSYVALLTSDVVAQRVIDKLGLNTGPAELAAKISAVNVPPSTALIDIAVRDSSPVQARRIADTLANEFVAYTDSLESPTGEDAQKVRTTVVSGAGEPESQLGRRIGLAALITALAALAGAVAVWIRLATDPVLRTPGQAASAAGVPALGEVDSRLAASLPELEPFRILRTGIRRQAGDGAMRVLQVSPIDDAHDVRQIALNLGQAMTLDGSSCAVVEACDDSAARTWLVTPEQILTASSAASIGDLRHRFDHVIVATPPVRSGPIASATSELCDGVLLISTTGYTARRNAERAASGLRSTGATLVGIASRRER